jgi:hypothetical protein
MRAAVRAQARTALVSVMMPAARAKTGVTMRSAESGVIVTYKQPKIGVTSGVVAAITFDDVGDARAKGRLELSAPDGTHVSGSFDATVCASVQHATATSTLLGIPWGSEKDPTDLPRDPVATLVLGATAKPAAVESIDWDDGTLAQHDLHFFMSRPAKSCDFDQMTPGVKLGFPSALRKGLTMRARVTTTTTRGKPWAVVQWNEPGSVLGIEGGGFVSATIDDETPNELRGRVLAWWNDPSKSMIAGAFIAKRCHVTP